MKLKLHCCCIVLISDYPELSAVMDLDRKVNLKPLPFWSPIPGGVYAGKMIEIRGSIPYGAEVFQVNLTAGEDRDGHTVDKLLHVSVRFNQHRVVLNAFESGQWGIEETDGGLPFASGKPFLMLILIDATCFQIAVDGKHRWTFEHRLNLTRASHVYIDGAVKLEEVKFIDKPIPGQQIGACIIPPSGAPQIITDPKVPFYHSVAGGFRVGTMISITGRPFASAHKFTINLQSGAAPYPPPDICFHLDVRFYNSSIVRNNQLQGSWGTEEKDMSYFPFAQSVVFDMMIKIEADNIHVALNGQTLFKFKHRVHPLTNFNTLFIDHDVVLASVRIDDCY